MSQLLIKRINSLEERVKAIENYIYLAPLRVSAEKAAPQSKQISLTEFLREKKPSDGVKKTLAIGYYIQCFEGKNNFNVKDLKKGFQRARETKPLNLSDKVNMAIRNGFFNEAPEKKDNKKAWHLTDTGIKFIENSFKK